MVSVMIIVGLLMLVIGLTAVRPVLLGVLMVTIAGWLFHSLTIELADGELRWRFGPGLIRKRVQLNEIASVKPVRTNFIEGWGIHFSRFGWLYNVSGFGAVAITLRNGKRLALGTDEPETLAKQLQDRLGETKP
jgi:hypothetical protein